MDFQAAISRANSLEDETGKPHRVKPLGYADENDVVQYTVEELVFPEPPPKAWPSEDDGFGMPDLDEYFEREVP